MTEQQTATCPECSRTISPEDTIIFGLGNRTRVICSHFAPVTSRNRTKQEQERRINRKRGTACCRTLFPQDQRVTGHGRVVLITQRSLVQIQPPQPRRSRG